MRGRWSHRLNPQAKLKFMKHRMSEIVFGAACLPFAVFGGSLSGAEIGYEVTRPGEIVPDGSYEGVATGGNDAYGLRAGMYCPASIGGGVSLSAVSEGGDSYGFYLDGSTGDNFRIEAEKITAYSNSGAAYGIYINGSGYFSVGKIESEISADSPLGNMFGIFIGSSANSPKFGGIDANVRMGSGNAAVGIYLKGVSSANGNAPISGGVNMVGSWGGSANIPGLSYSGATGIWVESGGVRNFDSQIHIDNSSGGATGIRVGGYGSSAAYEISISKSVEVAGTVGTALSISSVAKIYNINLSGRIALSAKSHSGGNGYAISADIASGDPNAGADLCINGDAFAQTLIGDIYLHRGGGVNFDGGSFVLDSFGEESRIHFMEAYAVGDKNHYIRIKSGADVRLVKSVNFEAMTEIDGGITLTAKSLSEYAGIILKDQQDYMGWKGASDLTVGGGATLTVLLLDDFTAGANDSLRVICNEGTGAMRGNFGKVRVMFENGQILAGELYDFDMSAGVLTFRGAIPEAPAVSILFGIAALGYAKFALRKCKGRNI